MVEKKKIIYLSYYINIFAYTQMIQKIIITSKNYVLTYYSTFNISFLIMSLLNALFFSIHLYCNQQLHH